MKDLADYTFKSGRYVGLTFREVYDNEPGIVRWVKGRNLSGAMEAFQRYVMERESYEAEAKRVEIWKLMEGDFSKRS